MQADIELLKREKERLEQEQNKLEFLEKLNAYQAKLEQELVDLHEQNRNIEELKRAIQNKEIIQAVQNLPNIVVCASNTNAVGCTNPNI